MMRKVPEDMYRSEKETWTVGEGRSSKEGEPSLIQKKFLPRKNITKITTRKISAGRR